MVISVLIKKGLKWCVKRAPTILTVASVTGLLGSVVLGCAETPKAVAAVKEAKKEKADKEGVIEKLIEDGDYDDEQLDHPLIFAHIVNLACERVKLTKWEWFKATAPVYWPTAVMTLGTAGCIIFTNRLHLRRTAALAAALGASDKAFKKYKDKVREMIGDKAEKEIVEKVEADDFLKNPPKEEEIIQTRFGSYLCREPITGQYFRSSIDAIRRAAMEVTSRLRIDGVVPLSEFIDELEINEADAGDIIGWYADDPRDEINIGFSYSSHPITGEPCAVIVYYTAPTYKLQ